MQHECSQINRIEKLEDLKELVAELKVIVAQGQKQQDRTDRILEEQTKILQQLSNNMSLMNERQVNTENALRPLLQSNQINILEFFKKNWSGIFIVGYALFQLYQTYLSKIPLPKVSP